MRNSEMKVGKSYYWSSMDMEVVFVRFTENYLCIVEDENGTTYAVAAAQLTSREDDVEQRR